MENKAVNSVSIHALNPLLNPGITQDKIEYKKIEIHHFSDAFDKLLPELKAEHEWKITQGQLTYQDLFEYQTVSSQLESALGILSHLNNVVQTPEVRDMFDKYVGPVSSAYDEIGLDERAYYKLKEYMNTKDYENLDEVKKKVIEDSLFNYEIGGINLPQDKKDELKHIGIQLSELTTLFDNNLTQTEAQMELILKESDLKGLPERALKNAELISSIPENTYKVTYASGLYSDISAYGEIEETRRHVYEQSLMTGHQNGYDNRPVLEKIVKLRQQKAHILGFESHAHSRLLKRMVKEPQKALAFIEDLATKSLPQAKIETQQVNEYGLKLLGHEPQYYDRGFITTCMQKELLNIDPEVIRQYFPVKKVVSGLFDIIETIYGIKFIQNFVQSTWHEDVLVYDLLDSTTHDEIGRVYLDLYKRAYKSSGAWHSGMVSRHETNEGLTLPVSYIICNAPKDVEQEPTFEFDDIVTLFHEMGHGLHHLLTQVNEEYYSGINHVQHDAVELPSQFMENFCWDYEILKLLSRHIHTGEILPKAQFDNILKGKTFLAANQMLRQAIFSQLDMRVYSEIDANPLDIEQEVFEQWKTRERDIRNLFLPTFSHIFAGGYSAGYYSYKWAEVLSSDAFAALKESGATYLEQKEVAQKFKTHILETGGYEDMEINFRNFRGRDPVVDFLLQDYGIKV